MQITAWRLKNITMFSPYLKVTYKILEQQSLNISHDHNLKSLKQGRGFSSINVNIQKEETDQVAKHPLD